MKIPSYSRLRLLLLAGNAERYVPFADRARMWQD